MRAGFARCCRSPDGRLIEYQVRCAAAAGAAPIVVWSNASRRRFTRRSNGSAPTASAVIPVSDGQEAASRFEAGALILLIGDGIAAAGRAARRGWPMRRSRRWRPCPTTRRTRRSSGSTRAAAGPGWRWSTARRWARPPRCSATGTFSRPLLRRALQEGRRGCRSASAGEPLLAEAPSNLAAFRARADCLVARPSQRLGEPLSCCRPIEEFATERLMETAGPARNGWCGALWR